MSTTTMLLRTSSLILRPSVRLFSTTSPFLKSATDTIADAAKAVDRTVADAAVRGIEKGGEF